VTTVRPVDDERQPPDASEGSMVTELAGHRANLERQAERTRRVSQELRRLEDDRAEIERSVGGGRR
jgi:hypothetical protein